MPPGTLKIDPKVGIRFKLIKSTVGDWTGNHKNKLGSIRDRIIEVARTRIKEAVTAFRYDAALENRQVWQTDKATFTFKRLYNAPGMFEWREFGW